MAKEERVKFRFLLVTDRLRCPGNFVEKLNLAIGAGVDAIQLREKDLSGKAYLMLARQIKQMIGERHIALLINDRLDVALTVKSQGIHLPGNSFPVSRIRKILDSTILIGRSTHHIDEALDAAESGADFVTFGPVYATESKMKYGPPVGVENLKKLCHQSPVPVFAIGGITVERTRQVMDAGAFGVAVISALFESPDIPETLRYFNKALTAYN